MEDRLIFLFLIIDIMIGSDKIIRIKKKNKKS